jgi:hypothetical protein
MFKKEAWILVAIGLFPIVTGLLGLLVVNLYRLFACP